MIINFCLENEEVKNRKVDTINFLSFLEENVCKVTKNNFPSKFFSLNPLTNQTKENTILHHTKHLLSQKVEFTQLIPSKLGNY